MICSMIWGQCLLIPADKIEEYVFHVCCKGNRCPSVVIASFLAVIVSVGILRFMKKLCVDLIV